MRIKLSCLKCDTFFIGERRLLKVAVSNLYYKGLCLSCKGGGCRLSAIKKILFSVGLISNKKRVKPGHKIKVNPHTGETSIIKGEI